MAGRRLSVRDIELLAHAYFRGPASLREAIEGGKLAWSLEQLKGVPEDREGCSEFERVLLKELQILRRSMQRVMAKCHDPRLKSRAFYAQANLLCAGLLSTLEPFGERMKEFYDRYRTCVTPFTSCIWPGRRRARSAGNSTSATARCGRSSASREPCPRRCGRTRSRSIPICSGVFTNSATAGFSASTRSWWKRKKIQVSYSTLTRLVRELELGKARERPLRSRARRAGRRDAARHQSVYKVKLSGKPTRVIASLLYLRYSKRRYLKFYRAFNRFAMKCFLHEALMFWGYAARQCIIDNTNLARLRGSGRLAVIVPEMATFAERYGFQFLCHEIRHCNRKAGEERSFWTVETNFLPGRSFENLEDLNRQAFQWATVRMEHRPASKTRLIPAKAFEHECSYLTEAAGPSARAVPLPGARHGQIRIHPLRGQSLLDPRKQAGRRSRCCNTRTA